MLTYAQFDSYIFLIAYLSIAIMMLTLAQSGAPRRQMSGVAQYRFSWWFGETLKGSRRATQ